MFRIWFERPMPSQYASLLEGAAIPIWPSRGSAGGPWDGLPGSHAIIAGARLRYDGALMDRVPALRVIARTSEP